MNCPPYLAAGDPVVGVLTGRLESLFYRPISVSPGPNHSHAEERFRAIGRTVRGRHVFVVFTLRLRDGDVFIRPISARYMHQKEIEHYEKATQVQKR